MRPFPRDPELGGALSLLREGYLFLPRRFAELDTDVMELRLLGVPFVALRGREGARLFYDRARFVRKGAAPKAVQRTLFGERRVQTLDGDAHAHRKAMFMSLMSRARIDALMETMWSEWYAALDRWERRAQITIFEEAQEVMCRAACAWAGVPLREGEVRLRAEDFGAMIDGFGAPALRNVKGRLARSRGERWSGGVIERVRRGELRVPEGSAAHVIAMHISHDGGRLSTHDAAVELMNVLRPIVAIATYVTFCAHALHHHTGARGTLRAGGPETCEAFVQEVRRFYPFTPFLGARVKEAFEWRGYRFPTGRRVLLDVYGTDHDARLFDDPDAFRPERFRGWSGGPFDLIPQGGGDHRLDHRCAGEWITIEAMKVAVTFLVRAIEYRMPTQDMSIDLGRIPTLPKSAMLVRDVRPAPDAGERPPITRPPLGAFV